MNSTPEFEDCHSVELTVKAGAGCRNILANLYSWCDENVGQEDIDWVSTSDTPAPLWYYILHFRFKNDGDAVMFKLKFGGK